MQVGLTLKRLIVATASGDGPFARELLDGSSLALQASVVQLDGRYVQISRDPAASTAARCYCLIVASQVS